MIVVEVRDDECGIGVTLTAESTDDLDNPAKMATIGRLVAGVLQRKRNQIRCEREGHFAAEGVGDVWFCPRCMAPLEAAA